MKLFKCRGPSKEKILFEIIDKGNRSLFYGEIYDLPLKNSRVIEKSIEFFSDPNPCYIHKSAVMERLYGEILEFIQAHNKNIFSVCEFPEELLSYIDFSS